MAMQRDQIVAEILKNAGLYGDKTNYETRAQSWLNLILIRVARRHFFNDLKQLTTTATTTASKKIYSLAADWSLTNIHKIHSIRLISGQQSRKLEPVGSRRADTYLPYPEGWSQYKSVNYVLWGGNCELIQIPDATYTLWIRWSKWPTEFVNPTDTCEILHIDDLLVLATTAWSYASIDKMDDAKAWAKNAEEAYAEIIRNDETEPDFEPQPEGFRGDEEAFPGEYWIQPFIINV